MWRLSYLLPLFFLLVSCGGGGSNSSPVRLTNNNPKLITVNALSTNENTQIVELTFNGKIERHVQASSEVFNPSIVDTYFDRTSDTTGNLIIKFASALTLGEGTYDNKIKLFSCSSSRCQRGYELYSEIDTILVVTSVEVASVSIQETITARGSQYENTSAKTQKVPITVTDSDVISIADLHLNINEIDSNQVGSFVNYEAVDSNQLNLLVGFSGFLPLGNHKSSYQIDVCIDEECLYPLAGSPLTLNVDYFMSKLPIDVAPISPNYRVQLEHNIIDSEYSSKLDSIIIASSLPKNSIYIYKLSDLSKVEEVELGFLPTSVSVANLGDSNKIVVGHDSMVTYIEYNEVNPDQSFKNLFNTPMYVNDLVANDKFIYAVSRGYNASPYKIVIEDGTGVLINSFSFSKIKMHPNLTSIYASTDGGWIGRLDIEQMTDNFILYNKNGFSGCDSIWLSNDGNRVFTECALVYDTPDSPSLDLVFSESLNVYTGGVRRYQINSVSESSSKNEIALIQADKESGCDYQTENCIAVLSLFTKDSLDVITSYGTENTLVDGVSYIENTRFSFYNKTGDSIFVVTELQGAPSPKSYILEINR